VVNETSPAFGDLLRRFRSGTGLSQEELAERAGLSRNGISDLERGVHASPRLETVRMLADALALGEADRGLLLAAARPALFRDNRSNPGTRFPVPPPGSLTSFIGRDGEVDALTAALLEDGARLVTVTGAGGTGKTRLALEVVAKVQAHYADGVCFVDLAPVADPALVLPAIGAALGLREGEVSEERLGRVLGSKQLLLVLDNVERVVAAAPVVTGLLARAAGVSVLATSRTPLHGYGEREFPLAPLTPPDPGNLPPYDQLRHNAAVRLFAERARAVQPSFALTQDTAPAVARICHRLDGLPLAIELAAARVKVLPPQALLERLEKRLPLLTGGARTLPARQQTMRDTIAWSHGLLSSEEQILFRRLAAFPGGCTLDGAAAVAAPEQTPTDVLKGIAALVDMSLLRYQEGADGEPRYRMLETIREYGLLELEASDDADLTRGRLAAWCLALAEQDGSSNFSGDVSPDWFARLDEELPNLRAAVDWLLARDEAARALQLVVAASDFWIFRHLNDADLYRWLETALISAPDAPARDRALAHWILSYGTGTRGDNEAALHHAERLLKAAEESRDRAMLATAQLALAYVWEFRGEIERAAAAYAAAIPGWQGASEPSAWYARAELADKHVLLGDLHSGVPLLDEALDRLRQANSRLLVLLVINLRGHAALLQGDLPLASRMFAESLARAQDLRNTPALLSAIAGLAGVTLARGDGKRAARLLGTIAVARDAAGLRHTDNGHHVGRISDATRSALNATEFECAFAAGRTVSLAEAIAEATAVAAACAASPAG
jgi:predicted ATPase/DNA-binding XRE family transcriptional regulator